MALTKAMSKIRRKQIATAIFDRYVGVVQRGPYTGLKLGSRSNISQGPLGLKVLGLYEKPVVSELECRAPYTDLINLGAADGYMSLGPLHAGFCKRSICFELTQQGRDAVAKNAAANGLETKIVVRGKADETLPAQLTALGYDARKSVMLCDIEGAEFDVFTTGTLQFLHGTPLIIELHDRFLPQGTALRNALIARLPTGSSWKILTSGALSFDGIPDLEQLEDTDRGLVLSEGRKLPGEWLVVDYPAV